MQVIIAYYADHAGYNAPFLIARLKYGVYFQISLKSLYPSQKSMYVNKKTDEYLALFQTLIIVCIDNENNFKVLLLTTCI